MVTLQLSKLKEDTPDQRNWLENNYNNNNTNVDDEKEKNWHSTELICETHNDSIKDSRQSTGSDETTLPPYRENSSSTHCSNSLNDEDCLDIVEIDDNEIENDYVDDDDDLEEEDENIDAEMSGWIADTPNDKIQHETANGQILPSLDKTNFGQISIAHSQHVRVGNTTLYKGPVTIKQFVYTNSNPGQEIDGTITQGLENNTNDGRIVETDNSPSSPGYLECDKVQRWLWTWRCAAMLSVLALVLVTSVVVVFVTNTKNPEFNLPNLGTAIDPDDILTENVRFVQRVGWGAQPPEGVINVLETVPVPYVIVSHTASEACSTQAECVQRVRLAQTMHIEGNGWSDIGYNFLIGGDGLIYVGRGWDQEGAHAFGFNKKSIGISFVGTFNKAVPPSRQVYALKQLIKIGIDQGKIAENYKLLAHRQVAETLSPGDVLYAILQTFDHWSKKP